MNRLFLAPLLALLLAGVAVQARADGQDMVKLKDGAVLFGTITEDNEDAVIIVANGVSRRISRGMVLRTQFAGAQPSDALQAQPQAEPVEQAPADVIPTENEYVGGIGNYYDVPQDQVAYVQQAGIPVEELPVLFFLNSRCHVGFHLLCDLRLSGLSWGDIMMRYSLRPDIFWFDVGGPLPGDDPGYFLYRPRREWRRMHLSDEDIIHCANLRYVSASRHISPSRLIVVNQVGGHSQRQWGAFHPAVASHAPHFTAFTAAHASVHAVGPAHNVKGASTFQRSGPNAGATRPGKAIHNKPQAQPGHSQVRPVPRPAGQSHGVQPHGGGSEPRAVAPQGNDKGGAGSAEGHRDR